MLRIGLLEQLDLSSILLRIETHSKTGLMVVKQSGQWVEFYFRGGRLICIGPVRTNATLGERLLQDKAISSTGLQEALLVVGNAQQSETRMALTLMDLGCISHEALRTWSTGKAQEVLRVLLTWTHGEVHFEEETSPPPDRLLVALAISELLSSLPKKTPVLQSLPQHEDAKSDTKYNQEQPVLSAPIAVAYTSNAPALINPSDLLLDDSPAMLSSTERLSAVYTPNRSNDLMPLAPVATPMAQPVAVTTPTVVKRIDTSFMRPEMILIPVDLSASRDRNIQVQLTPEQWRLLTKVDSHTSLQAACMELGMPPEMVCQVAGELIAEGLIQLSLPGQGQMNELSPSSRELVASGVNNGYIVPALPASMAPTLPTSDVLPQFSSSLPFETQSQWGNGGNGATFIPGRGWIASPQPLQPLSTSGPLAATYSDMYAQVSGSR